jgi:putative phosphoribosyl transferase
VLGLPRGGVPVALEVALDLGAPLDVILVRKLGVPFQRELAMGAIGEGGVRVVNDEVVRLARVTDEELRQVESVEGQELERRARRFRGDRPPRPLGQQVALVVDDGIATGSTARAACEIARVAGAARVVLAVPVAPPGWVERMANVADEYVCLDTPPHFAAIGQFYADFTQVSDQEVIACLERAERREMASVGEPDDPPDPADPPSRDEEVTLIVGEVQLRGHLTLPNDPSGMVVFAHGSGSSRHSPRNRHVAAVLNDAGFGTLLFDLLTAPEENARENVFDIELLGDRLIGVTHWLHHDLELSRLPIGFFGASTGAAAALWAAAQLGELIAAVVSRGGRPDLAGSRLQGVVSPTLLVVGERDHTVLELNRDAQTRLTCENQLVVVPGATHLFEEPGALEAAAAVAKDWFVGHLALVPHPGT